MTNYTKKGFTLVELSIVLVIIGLLIGGILVAQSMIATTRLQAITRQLGQFDAATSNFETKFTGLPGDVSAVSGLAGTAGLSDGNGLITSTGSASASATFSGEIGQFWRDLSISGMSTEGDGASNTPANSYAQQAAAGNLTTGASANVPKSKGGRSTAVFVPAAIGTKNYYVLATTGNTASNAWVATAAASNNGALKPADALSLDTKLDDGKPDAGNIISVQFAAASNIAQGGVATCQASSAYVTATTTEDCSVATRVGLGTGNVK